MGFTIGMPSLKLSNIEGKGGKHCGNFGKVAKEALSERQGLDMDINPELANQNIYEGFATAEELIDYSNKHINELNAWRAEHGERACDRRKLKSDTVVMCATVIKPPAEMMSGFSDEQQKQFLEDSLEIFKGFVGEENIKAAAFHFDERVPHLHIFWEPMTDEHRICAKDMHNLKFFGKLNKEMPKQLREKGWSMVDDCKIYDKAEEEQKRIEMGEEKYKEYRKAQKANRGRDSRQFKHEVEKKIAEKQKELERVQADREAAERAAEQARADREANEQAAAIAVADRDAAEQAAADAKQAAEKAKSDRKADEHAAEHARTELAEIQAQAIAYIPDKKHITESQAAYAARVATAQQAAAVKQRAEELDAKETALTQREKQLEQARKSIRQIAMEQAQEIAEKPIAEAQKETAAVRAELAAEQTAHSQTKSLLHQAWEQIRTMLLAKFAPYWKNTSMNAHEKFAETLRRGETNADIQRRRGYQPIAQEKPQGQAQPGIYRHR